MPSIIRERLKFFKEDRQENENIATYIAELRKLSRFCDFRNNLEDMLRDRLVCGVRNNRMQQKLLSEPTLTLAQSVSITLTMEKAEQNLRDLHKETEGRINMVKFNTECFRCGKRIHHPTACRFKNAECYKCHSMAI